MTDKYHKNVNYDEIVLRKREIPSGSISCHISMQLLLFDYVGAAKIFHTYSRSLIIIKTKIKAGKRSIQCV